MGPSPELVAELVGLLYEAAACPERWAEFLEALRRASAAERVFSSLSSTGLCDLSYQVGFLPEAVQAYEQHYAALDPLMQGFVQRMNRYGDWVGNWRSAASERTVLRSEVYHDFMLKNGDTDECGLIVSGMGDGLLGGVSLLRGHDFDDTAVELLRILQPHVKRAFGLHRRLAEQRTHSSMLERSVDAARAAMASVDGSGRIIRISEALEALLAAGDGLRLEDGRLLAALASENAILSKLMRGAAETGGNSGEGVAVRLERRPEQQGGSALHSPASGGSLAVSRRMPKRPLQVIVSPFRSGEMLVEDRPAALVFVVDPDAQRPSSSRRLRELYGLSPMEASIGEAVAAGQEVKAIAASKGLTQDTVRFYLKSIFRKTGARRQSELVRLVLALPSV
jgi:DNA-binding CsgD family transcriptional regulator